VVTSSLIRRGTIKAIVELDIHCEQRDQTLNIVRSMTKSGGKLELYFDGDTDEPVEFSTVRDGNEFIVNWMDTTKADILSYYLINQEGFTSFFTSSNKERLDLVTRLSNTEFINEAGELVKEDIKELSGSLTDTKEEITKREGKVEGYEGQIKEANSGDPDKAKELAIKSIEEEIEAINQQEKDLSETINELKASNTSITKEITSITDELSKAREALVDTSDVEKEIKKLRAEKLETNSLIMDAKKNIQGSVHCPKCDHEFIVGGENVDFDVEREIIEDCKVMLEDIEQDETQAKNKLIEAEKLKTTFYDIDGKLIRAKNSKERIIETIERKSDGFKRFEKDRHHKQVRIKEIKEAPSTDNTALIESLRAKIIEENKEIKALNEDIEALNTEIFEIEQWSNNFKRFKIHIANSMIQEIQTRCNMNLEKIGSDLKVSIDGFKINADGNIKDDITALVVRDEPATYYSYSGGERGRVQFAIILAIQEIINSQNKYGGIKFLAVDEIFEGVDAKGLGNFMESIKDVGMAVMVTTHVSDRRTSSNKVTIEKVNGISRIKKTE